MRKYFFCGLAAAIVALGTAPAPAQDANKLNTQSLGKMLRDMGLEPESVGKDVYQVTVDRENWKVFVMISTSTDNTRVWFEAKFPPIDAPERAPAAAWLNLLKENERVGPAHFAFDQKDKRVHLFKAIDNANITPARMRREIDAFDATVRKTEAVWKPENFKPGAVVGPGPVEKIDPKVGPGSAELNRLRGTWKAVRLEVKGKRVPAADVKSSNLTFTFAGDKLTMRGGGSQPREVRVSVNAAPKLKTIDFTDTENRVEKGVYILEGNTLSICFSAPGDPRPDDLPSDDGKSWYVVLQRE